MFRDLLVQMGFELEATGGGCTAWVKELADRSTVYLTDLDGQAVDSTSESVVLSRIDHRGCIMFEQEMGSLGIALHRASIWEVQASASNDEVSESP